MESARLRFSVQSLIEVAVVIVSIAIAYASNRYRLSVLEHRVTQHEVLTQGFVPPTEIKRLEDRVRELERQVAILQTQIDRHHKPERIKLSRRQCQHRGSLLSPAETSLRIAPGQWHTLTSSRVPGFDSFPMCPFLRTDLHDGHTSRSKRTPR